MPSSTATCSVIEDVEGMVMLSRSVVEAEFLEPQVKLLLTAISIVYLLQFRRVSVSYVA